MKKPSIMINIVSSKGQFQRTYNILPCHFKLKQKTNMDAIGQFLIFGVKISDFWREESIYGGGYQEKKSLNYLPKVKVNFS